MAHDDDEHHDDHHDDGSPAWVLVPLAVGVVVALVLVALLGLQSGATPHHVL